MNTGIAHVWVRESNGPRQWPGFLLEWRHVDGAWSAMVLYRREGPVQFITEWIDRDRLTASPWRPHGGTQYG